MLLEIPRGRGREVMGVGEGEVVARDAAAVAVEVVLTQAGMAT